MLQSPQARAQEIICPFIYSFLNIVAKEPVLFIQDDLSPSIMESNPENENDMKSYQGMFGNDLNRMVEAYGKLFKNTPQREHLTISRLLKEESIEIEFNTDEIENRKYGLLIAECFLDYTSAPNLSLRQNIFMHWDFVYRLLKKLKHSGALLVSLEKSFGATAKSRTFLRNLKKQGYYLNAVFESPKGMLLPLSTEQPNLCLFSKKDNQNQIFIASLEEAGRARLIVENYFNHKSFGNLSQGDIIDQKLFMGFNNYRYRHQLKTLQNQYSLFEEKSLGEVTTIVKSDGSDFDHADNFGEFLLIPRKGNLRIFSSLHVQNFNPKDYFLLKIDNAVAMSKYLDIYFNSSLGHLSIKDFFDGHYHDIGGYFEKDLKEVRVPIPPLKVQEEMVVGSALLDNISQVVGELNREITLNPGNSAKIFKKLTNTLDALNELSKEDKVLSMIREGEGSHIEFKQTFSVDIKTNKKEKYISESSLKSIAGFLNNEGGALLIGVKDDKSLCGIEHDAFQSNDNYLLHFKNKLKETIGVEFLDYITSEIVELDNKKILMVACKPSMRPVYLYGKDFYKRSGPATDKLEGPELVEYVKRHFK